MLLFVVAFSLNAAHILTLIDLGEDNMITSLQNCLCELVVFADLLRSGVGISKSQLLLPSEGQTPGFTVTLVLVPWTADLCPLLVLFSSPAEHLSSQLSELGSSSSSCRLVIFSTLQSQGQRRT